MNNITFGRALVWFFIGMFVLAAAIAVLYMLVTPR